MITRRGALAGAGLLLGTGEVRAQAYPNRAVRVIVPYAPGGADTYIRPLMGPISRALGQSVVVDTVVGGGGAVGANRVRTSPPDGYTLLFAGTGALTAAPRLQNLGYTAADFAPIANLVSIPFVLAARRGASFNDFTGFLAAARAKPEGLSYGSTGVGGTPHLIMEQLSKVAGIKMLHVPYSGVATASVALLAGDIDLVMGAPSFIMPLLDRGVVPLVQTGARRMTAISAVPTFRESGVDLEMVTRFGFVAPNGTDTAILDRWSSLILEGGADPGYVQAMQRNYNEVELLDRARFAAFLTEEDAATERMLRELNLRG
ncbi:tripartite tricarboxylate transporter substrate binding protein [Roseomonas sp. AR75]|uniref:tripartite tricarboxylate transporter substrate binding protein n=1 Tax=Roseomonas sp. AR75 TaxID=2562311 RepID=UPI0010C022A1|nr:tripartite tricarboxylate transporter substrate binding protein [Roseomonas sp. AR75]